MRSSATLLLVVLMALMGMAQANQAAHRAVWVRDAQAGTLSASATVTSSHSASTPTGTTVNGAKCTKSVDCASGNCYKSKCADPLPLGQKGCYKDAGCTTGNCNKGRCVPADGTGLVGDRCNASGQCSTGNCSRSHCAEQVEVGASCYKNVNCVSGNCVNDTCIADESVAIGNKCNRSQQCKTGNYCRHGACSPMRPNGSKCYKDQGCISGNCENKRCTPVASS